MQKALRDMLDQARADLASAKRKLDSAYNICLAEDDIDIDSLHSSLQFTRRAIASLDDAESEDAPVPEHPDDEALRTHQPGWCPCDACIAAYPDL